MILNIISFFVGILLLIFLPIIINKGKFQGKMNNYFFVIIALAGMQRFIFGLINFGIITDLNSRINSITFLSFLLPPLFLIFSSNLLYQPTTIKKEITLFSISTLIVLLIVALKLDKKTNQVLFMVYSTIYLGLLIKIYYNSFKIKKTIKEVAQLKAIKNWSILIFLLFVIIYLLSNFIYYLFNDQSNKLILNKFYNLSSIIWLFVILYLLMNPITLYGKKSLLKTLNKSNLNEIQVWNSSKKIVTEIIDIDIEKKVNLNLEKILFDINAFETDLFNDFKKIASLKELSLILGYPQSHLKYIFKYYNNYSHSEYVTVQKIKYSIQLIENGYLKTHTVDSLSEKCLFNSRITFYNNFIKLVGYSTTDYHLIITSK